MSKRAVLAVLTLASESSGAKLCSVFVRVVELFNSCVAVNARITLGTLLLLCDEAAKLRFVRTRISTSVLGLFMVVWAFLKVVVRVSAETHVSLESIQIQHFHKLGFIVQFLRKCRFDKIVKLNVLFFFLASYCVISSQKLFFIGAVGQSFVFPLGAISIPVFFKVDRWLFLFVWRLPWRVFDHSRVTSTGEGK